MDRRREAVLQHYMKEMCLDREANVKSIDTKLLKCWEDKYGKSTHVDESHAARALEEANHCRAKPHTNDGSIKQLLQGKHEKQQQRKVTDE